MTTKKKVTEVRDAKQLSDFIKNKSSKYMLAISIFDDDDKKIHSSVFTKDFPIGDMDQSLKDMARCVNSVYQSEQRMLKQPDNVQSEHTANLIK